MSSPIEGLKQALGVLGFAIGSQALHEALRTYWFPTTTVNAGSSSKTVTYQEKAKEDVLLKLPVVDFSAFFNKDKDPEAYIRECKKAAEAFHKYGVLAVRDPRVFSEDNERFLDLMESYFEISDGKRDARPDLSYQVGVTPEGTERARDQVIYLLNSRLLLFFLYIYVVFMLQMDIQECKNCQRHLSLPQRFV